MDSQVLSNPTITPLFVFYVSKESEDAQGACIAHLSFNIDTTRLTRGP